MTEQRLSDSAEELLAHWQRSGTGLRPGATEEELVQLEASLGAPLPADFRAFYRRVNGMVDDTSDEIMFSLWSTGVILAASDDGRGKVSNGGLYVPIGDFLIDSHYYALRLDGPEIGSVHLVASGTPHERVAETFTGFLQRLWADADGLEMFPRDRAPGV